MVVGAAEFYEAYQRLGSVHRVGKEYGVSGDFVHSRLRAGGFDISRAPALTEDQKQEVINYYQNTPSDKFDLGALANRLGKSKPQISKFARQAGLTIAHRPINDEQRHAASQRTKRQWQTIPHPRGMAGKEHTEEVKSAMSARQRKVWATAKAFNVSHMAPEVRAARSERMAQIAAERPACKSHTRAKGGYREDLGQIYFRSSWEANYARYLNLMKRMRVVVDWEYEPETFWFENIKRGVRSYKPDFKVLYVGITQPSYQEVKGWMDAKSKTKIRRFAKYFPQHDLTIIGAKEYRAIRAKWKSSIPLWEGA